MLHGQSIWSILFKENIVKLKAVITNNAPIELFQAFSSADFARSFLRCVAEENLGATNTMERPAEYYVQEPDRSIATGPNIGVELRLTGVSRNGRKASQFHGALHALVDIAEDIISDVLTELKGSEEVQLFCVLMLDGDIETEPGSGVYSSVLETEAIWIRGGVV